MWESHSLSAFDLEVVYTHHLSGNTCEGGRGRRCGSQRKYDFLKVTQLVSQQGWVCNPHPLHLSQCSFLLCRAAAVA